MNKNMEKRLEAVEMWFWRRMTRDITERKDDEWRSFGQGRNKKTVVEYNRRRRWGFIGHELRREWGLKRQIVDAEIAGKRARGRLRSKMLDWMMKKLDVRDGKQLGKIARGIRRWKKSSPLWFVYGIQCQDTERRRRWATTALRSQPSLFQQHVRRGYCNYARTLHACAIVETRFVTECEKKTKPFLRKPGCKFQPAWRG